MTLLLDNIWLDSTLLDSIVRQWIIVNSDLINGIDNSIIIELMDSDIIMNSDIIDNISILIDKISMLDSI
jgi:hypothetical protein